MIHVTQAGGQLPATRSGSGYNHNRLACFYMFIGSISLITHNQINVRWITFCEPVGIYPDTIPFQLVFK